MQDYLLDKHTQSIKDKKGLMLTQPRTAVIRNTLLVSFLALSISACSDGTTDSATTNSPSNIVNGPLNDSPNAPSGTPSNTTVITDNQTNNQSSATSFAPGAEFTSNTVGVKIRMPNTITGTFDPRSGTLAFNNAENSLGGFVFGGSAGGVQAGASRAIRTLLPQLGLEIGQVFLDNVNAANSTTSQFSAVSGNGAQVFMQLDVRQGDTGNYVAVLGNSNMNEQSVLSALVSEMAGSIVFSTPAPANALVNLGGFVFQANSSNTNFVGSDNSTTSGDESTFITCTDSRYRFSASSQFFLNFGDGSSGSTSESTLHEGQFANQLDFAGNQLISLHSTDQGTFVFNVTVNNGAVFLDQTAYTQTGTSEQQCG